MKLIHFGKNKNHLYQDYLLKKIINKAINYHLDKKLFDFKDIFILNRKLQKNIMKLQQKNK